MSNYAKSTEEQNMTLREINSAFSTIYKNYSNILTEISANKDANSSSRAEIPSNMESLLSKINSLLNIITQLRVKLNKNSVNDYVAYKSDKENNNSQRYIDVKLKNMNDYITINSSLFKDISQAKENYLYKLGNDILQEQKRNIVLLNQSGRKATYMDKINNNCSSSK